MKIIDVKWFTARSDCIGIVLTQNDMGDHKAYIGVGRGEDEGQDAQQISTLGASFHYGHLVWPNIKKWHA